VCREVPGQVGYCWLTRNRMKDFCPGVMGPVKLCCGPLPWLGTGSPLTIPAVSASAWGWLASAGKAVSNPRGGRGTTVRAAEYPMKRAPIRDLTRNREGLPGMNAAPVNCRLSVKVVPGWVTTAEAARRRTLVRVMS
jgi:hypothetical protein